MSVAPTPAARACDHTEQVRCAAGLQKQGKRQQPGNRQETPQLIEFLIKAPANVGYPKYVIYKD